MTVQGIAIKSQLNASSSIVALTRRTNGADGLQMTKVGNGTLTQTPFVDTAYVKIARRGNVISTYVPVPGAFTVWQLVGQVTLPDLGASAYVGIVAASGSTSATTRSLVHAVDVSKANPFTTKDVGTPAPAGSTSYDAGTESWTVKGGGAGMVGTADSLHFAYRTLKGDGHFVARLEPPNGPSTGARGGVMVRTSLAANAAGAFVSMDNSDREWLTQRTTSGGTAVDKQIIDRPFGGWMEIQRAGSDLLLYSSTDGVSWDLLGKQVLPAGTTTLYMGLADTGGAPGNLGVVTASDQTLWTYLVQ